jgi:hypothetical protein
MTASPASFIDVISLWETTAEFARQIGEPYENARQWRLNDSIPARAFDPIVRAARENGHHGVTHELLCGFAAAKHEQRIEARA